MSLDRGDAHRADAGSYPRACYHMGVFLRWAVARGIAADTHQSNRDRLAHAPGAYVVAECDTKLLEDDFSDAAQPFIRRIYDRYLPYYANTVTSATGQSYGTSLDDDVIAELETFLDEQLAPLRPEAPGESEPVAALVQRVVHAKFGPGTVVGTMPSDGAAKVSVDFAEGGTKTMLARFLKPAD